MSGAPLFAGAGRAYAGATPRGVGHNMTFNCMGCGRAQPTAGSKGTGIRRRCADCVAQRQPKG